MPMTVELSLLYNLKKCVIIMDNMLVHHADTCFREGDVLRKELRT